jgi:hypothetical protein
MLTEIERSRPDFDVTELTRERALVLDLWEERGAFTDADALTEEITELLDEISNYSNDWAQDRRDAALSLVEALAVRPDGLPILNGPQQAAIGKSYIGVVENLQPDADWLGAPWMAMELGKNVSAILGKEIDFVEGMRLRGQLAEGWSNYVAGVSFNKETSARPGVEEGMFEDSFQFRLSELQNNFLSRTNGQSQHEAQRTSPVLEKPISELAIWYVQAAGQHSSAKLALMRTMPEYLKTLEQRSVDIAAFWNFNDPDKVDRALGTVLKDPLIEESFKAKFLAKTGGDYDSTTLAERRVLADLNLELVRSLYEDLYNRRRNYDEVSRRIIGQIDQSEGLDNPRAKLRPILKWIRQVEPSFQSYDTALIKAFIDEHEAQLRSFHESKYSGIDTALRIIETTLPPRSGLVQFMDRDLFDLKSANLTADCTAWNLDDGFNAWTLPVWLTNPNFNFAYIHHGNAMVAKFGIVLAFDGEQKPQVIIDSIETNKNLQNVDEVAALEAIYAGFVELQKWADRNNFGTLKVCTFTNSKELTANLPIVRNTKEDDRRLSFDGLVATKELMKSTGIEGEGVPAIYLQSSAIEYDDDGEEIVHGEYVEGAQTFEAIASFALERARKAASVIGQEELLSALRSGDKDMVMDGIIAALSPEFVRAFEGMTLEYDALHELYWNCKNEAHEKGFSLDWVFNQAMASLLEEERRSQLEDQRREKDIDWSLYDDEEGFERHLEELRREKELSRFYAPKDKDDDDILRSELVPRSFIVDDENALEAFLKLADSDEPSYLLPKYSNVIDFLEEIFGEEPESPGIDIVKAARYVFGVAEEVAADVAENQGQELDTLIPLSNNMPSYNRREMRGISGQ